MAFPAPKGLVEYHVKRSMSKYHIGAGAPEHTKGRGGGQKVGIKGTSCPLEKRAEGAEYEFQKLAEFS